MKKSSSYQLLEATCMPKLGAQGTAWPRALHLCTCAPVHNPTEATKTELELRLNLSLARILRDPPRT